jgi:hypothetical protein
MGSLLLCIFGPVLATQIEKWATTRCDVGNGITGGFRAHGFFRKITEENELSTAAGDNSGGTLWKLTKAEEMF